MKCRASVEQRESRRLFNLFIHVFRVFLFPPLHCPLFKGTSEAEGFIGLFFYPNLIAATPVLVGVSTRHSMFTLKIPARCSL